MPEVIAAPAPAAPSPNAAPKTGSGAPPSKPASAPAKPNSGGATSKPAVATAKPVSKPATNISDAYSQLDKMAGEVVEEEAPSGRQHEGEAEEASENEGEDQTEVQGEEPNPSEAKAKNPNEDARPRARTLRQTLDAVKAEYQKYKAETEKKLAEAAKAPADDPEKLKLGETLKQREERLAQLEEELRYTNYERSEDYKTRYETPFVEAYNAGRNKVAAMTLDDGNGGTRKGTAEDFDTFMRITDDDAAADRAVELFGNKAASVMYHREKVQELNGNRLKALEEYRKNGGEREKARQEALNNQRMQIKKTFDAEVQNAVEKYQWFKPIDGDEEGNQLLESGFKLADLAVGREVKGEDGQPIKLSPTELAKLHAAIRNKAGAFDRQVYLNAKLRKELKALKKQLQDYDASVPGNGSGKGKSKPTGSTWSQVDEALSQLAR